MNRTESKTGKRIAVPATVLPHPRFWVGSGAGSLAVGAELADGCPTDAGSVSDPDRSVAGIPLSLFPPVGSSPSVCAGPDVLSGSGRKVTHGVSIAEADTANRKQNNRTEKPKRTVFRRIIGFIAFPFPIEISQTGLPLRVQIFQQVDLRSFVRTFAGCAKNIRRLNGDQCQAGKFVRFHGFSFFVQ